MPPPKEKEIAEKVAECVESGDVHLSDHASRRMWQHGVLPFEVEEVLASGWHVPEYDEWSDEHSSWNYAIEGETTDGRELRIPVAFIELDDVLIVTVIDLNG